MKLGDREPDKGSLGAGVVNLWALKSEGKKILRSDASVSLFFL